MKLVGIFLWSIASGCVFVVLLASVLLGAGLKFGVVNSSSMARSINVGEVIFWTHADFLCCGDIILYERDGKRIAHRIVNFDGENLVVKGDSERSTPEIINISQVVGKFVFSISIWEISLAILFVSIFFSIFWVFFTDKNKLSKNTKK